MDQLIKVKVNLEDTQELITFIQETKDGKYTDQKPDVSQIIYKRIQLQEISQCQDLATEDVILYGISY